ncbi:hypothetical protein J6590_054405 [Homalodisca vitripennis]|nr:hypothetical protein J6590_054405 [Homalodisca vitripennis]
MGYPFAGDSPSIGSTELSLNPSRLYFIYSSVDEKRVYECVQSLGGGATYDDVFGSPTPLLRSSCCKKFRRWLLFCYVRLRAVVCLIVFVSVLLNCILARELKEPKHCKDEIQCPPENHTSCSSVTEYSYVELNSNDPLEYTTQEWYVPYPELFPTCNAFQGRIGTVKIQPLNVQGEHCGNVKECRSFLAAYKDFVGASSYFTFFVDGAGHVYGGSDGWCSFREDLWVAVMVENFTANSIEVDQIFRNFNVVLANGMVNGYFTFDFEKVYVTQTLVGGATQN